MVYSHLHEEKIYVSRKFFTLGYKGIKRSSGWDLKPDKIKLEISCKFLSRGNRPLEQPTLGCGEFSII